MADDAVARTLGAAFDKSNEEIMVIYLVAFVRVLTILVHHHFTFTSEGINIECESEKKQIEQIILEGFGSLFFALRVPATSKNMNEIRAKHEDQSPNRRSNRDLKCSMVQRPTSRKPAVITTSTRICPITVR
jgi:hypothetical protein